MVGVSLEESTVSESSLDASTAPTTATGDSTTNPSHDSLPAPSSAYPNHARRERTSTAEAFAKDLSFLLRSNSRLKCDPYTRSQTVLHTLQEDSKDHARHHPDYAHNSPQNPSKLDKFDLELRMLRERDTEKVKRPENRFYGFLRRGRLASRSAPKKRRSRSADEIAEMVEPLQSTTSLADGGHSVQDHGPTFVSPPIKHGPITPSSRPLSTATVTAKHANKNLPQLPPDPTTPTPRSIMSPTRVIGEPEQSKPRKKTFFGMITLAGSRRSSFSKSRPTTPYSSTPDNSLNSRHQRKPDLTVPSPPPQYHEVASIPLNDATNFRQNGDVAGPRSQPSFDISEPDSGLGIETVVAKTKLVTIMSPQPRPHPAPIPDVPTRSSSTPPRIGPGIDKSRRLGDGSDHHWGQDVSASGRTSPLAVLANSVFGGRKGKEKERIVDQGKNARMQTPASTSENEKGRQSHNSNQKQGKPDATNISGPMSLKLTRGRIKHGSFDFERPLSTSVGYPTRNARWSTSGSHRASSETERSIHVNGNGHLWNGPSSSTYPIQEERPSLTRSRSARDSDHYHQDRGRGQPRIRFADQAKGTQTRSPNPYDSRSRAQPQPQPPPPPSKSAGLGVGLLKNGGPTLPQANLPYRPEGGSWGRNSSTRANLGSTRYANGLPSFGMSATSLHLNGDANGPSSRSASPQITTLPMDRIGLKRHTGKGRSLDLGLELNWAPTRVRQEAVMDFSEIGVRSKWREEAEMKEFGRMKVLESFEQVLGENPYAKFREYVQRFDSRLIPLDGPSGLMHKVRRLLDASTKSLDEKKKQELLERLDRVVQHPR